MSQPRKTFTTFRSPVHTAEAQRHDVPTLWYKTHAAGNVSLRQYRDQPVEGDFLSGFKPVLELLEQDPGKIDIVWIRRSRRTVDTDRILDLCRQAGIRFKITDASLLDKICHAGHQGVVARLVQTGFIPFSELLSQAPVAPLPLIVILDQVQDAGNAGTIARTLYALGGAGLVIPRYNGVYLGSGARRTAAGSLEHLPVAKVTNLGQALDEAAANNFSLYAAAMQDQGKHLHNADACIFTQQLDLPALLVLGNEDHGIRPHLRKRCTTLSIPMLREFDSLNVAQAGGILISCFLRSLLMRTADCSTYHVKDFPS